MELRRTTIVVKTGGRISAAWLIGRIVYENDKRNGLDEAFDTDGDLVSKINYQNADLQSGLFELFHKNGKSQRKIMLRSVKGIMIARLGSANVLMKRAFFSRTALSTPDDTHLSVFQNRHA